MWRLFSKEEEEFPRSLLRSKVKDSRFLYYYLFLFISVLIGDHIWKNFVFMKIYAERVWKFNWNVLVSYLGWIWNSISNIWKEACILLIEKISCFPPNQFNVIILVVEIWNSSKEKNLYSCWKKIAVKIEKSNIVLKILVWIYFLKESIIKKNYMFKSVFLSERKSECFFNIYKCMLVEIIDLILFLFF